MGDETIVPNLEDFLRPRPGFQHRTDDYQYNRQLHCGLEVRDQAYFGSCAFHANLRIYELRAYRATGKYTPLSDDFLLAWHLLTSAVDAINHSEAKIGEGGSLLRSTSVASSFGLVPAEAWKPRISLSQSRDVIRRLLFHLNVIVHNSRITLKNMANANKSEFKPLNDFVIKALRDCIEAFVGPLPSTFEFEGQSFTPVEFAKLERYATPNPRRAAKPGREIIKVNGDPMVMFRRIQAQLDETKEPVAIGVHWEPTFIDRKLGIASIRAFSPYDISTPDMLRFITQMASESHSDDGPHAMLITDYALDAQGNPTKLLTQNSHGPGSGDEGFIHMYWDYFSAFFDSAALLNGY